MALPGGGTLRFQSFENWSKDSPSVGRGREPHRNYDSYNAGLPRDADEAPGRVRVTHIAPGTFHLPADVNCFPPTDFRPSQRIRLSGFAAPVAAPQPRSLSPRLEGTWTRTIGTDVSSFSHRDGRVNGSWQVTNGIEVRFSGSCTVTKDDQFVGVIDEVEARGTDGESFQAHVLVQRLVDQPFAARFVVDGDALIIKDIRCAGISPSIKDEKQTSDLLDYVRTFACGRFERGEQE
ncbi:MAG: hypothetical protein M3552_14515 [Planctomycetota bacterium]|nr:hypothetical protein [Planctomycetaceae bacterium]MDQ3331843.1 hypothetical protein [Planctomycetota bacterium]